MRGLGLGLGLRRKRRSGGGAPAPVLIYSDTDVSDWTPTAVTFAVSPWGNPETGGPGIDVFETVANSTHSIGTLIPFQSGKTYQIRLLVRGINESIVGFFSSVDGGTHYLYINFTTGANLLSQAVSNVTQQSLGGGWYVVTFEMTVTAAGGSPDLTIGISKAGPTPVFPGVVTDGITVGSVMVYDITGAATVPTMDFSQVANSQYVPIIQFV